MLSAARSHAGRWVARSSSRALVGRHMIFPSPCVRHVRGMSATPSLYLPIGREMREKKAQRRDTLAALPGSPFQSMSLRWASSVTGGGDLRAEYDRKVANGILQADEGQMGVINQLDDLRHSLVEYMEAFEGYKKEKREWDREREEKILKLTRAQRSWREKVQDALVTQWRGLVAKESGPRRFADAIATAAQLPMGTRPAASMAEESGGVVRPHYKSLLLEADFEAMREREALERQREVVKRKLEKQLDLPPEPERPQMPLGVYLYGPVGTGKTMVMDTLAATKIPTGKAVRDSLGLEDVAVVRMHYSELMRATYSGLHAYGEMNAERKGELKLLWGVRDAVDYVIHNIFIEGMPSYEKAVLGKEEPRKGEDDRRTEAERQEDHRIECMEKYARNFSPSFVLCLDEFQMVDVADATLTRTMLFRLLNRGAVLISTSNLPPEKLFQASSHTTQEQEMFVDLISSACQVQELLAPHEEDPHLDYRLLAYQSSTSKNDSDPDAAHGSGLDANVRVSGDMHSFVVQKEGGCNEELERIFASMAEDIVEDDEVDVLFNRRVRVPKMDRKKQVAWFAFDDLCTDTLGPGDYCSLAKEFSTVFVADVPILSVKSKDRARRFISLVDELYNQRVRLVCSAAAPPEDLFSDLKEGPDCSDSLLEGLQFERGDDFVDSRAASVASSNMLSGESERFAFRRAVSRLYEMQSHGYVANAR